MTPERISRLGTYCLFAALLLLVFGALNLLGHLPAAHP